MHVKKDCEEHGVNTDFIGAKVYSSEIKAPDSRNIFYISLKLKTILRVGHIIYIGHIFSHLPYVWNKNFKEYFLLTYFELIYNICIFLQLVYIESNMTHENQRKTKKYFSFIVDLSKQILATFVLPITKVEGN